MPKNAPGLYVVPDDESSIALKDKPLFYLLSFDMAGFYHPPQDLFNHFAHRVRGDLQQAKRSMKRFKNGAVVEVSRRYLAGFDDFHFEVSADLLTFDQVEAPWQESVALYNQSIPIVGSTLKSHCRLSEIGHRTDEKSNRGKILYLKPDVFGLPESLGKLYAQHFVFMLNFASAKDSKHKKSLQLTLSSIIDTTLGYRIAHESTAFRKIYDHRFKAAWGQKSSGSCAQLVVHSLIFAANDMAIVLDSMLDTVVKNKDSNNNCKKFLINHFSTHDLLDIQEQIDKFKHGVSKYLTAIDKHRSMKDLYQFIQNHPDSPFKKLGSWKVIQDKNLAPIGDTHANAEQLKNNAVNPDTIYSLLHSYNHKTDNQFIPRKAVHHQQLQLHALKSSLAFTALFRLSQRISGANLNSWTEIGVLVCAALLSSNAARNVNIAPKKMVNLVLLMNMMIIFAPYLMSLSSSPENSNENIDSVLGYSVVTQP